MPEWNKLLLGKHAKELGFVRDTYEKVCRLTEILKFFENDAMLGNSLALKGGTAINLTIFNLPRLSVDIDLDFSENVTRDEMMATRSIINDRIEKFASKIVALINRTAPRDLYDVYNLVKLGLIDESEDPLLRKCVVFYSAIGAESPPFEFQFNTIDQVTQNRIKTDLYPVLRNKDKFDLKTAQLQVKTWLESLLKLEDNEQEFLNAFRNKIYQPELLFESTEIVERIRNHPMALWKCSQKLILTQEFKY